MKQCFHLDLLKLVQSVHCSILADDDVIMTSSFISWSSSLVIPGVTYKCFDLNREPSKIIRDLFPGPFSIIFSIIF